MIYRLNQSGTWGRIRRAYRLNQSGNWGQIRRAYRLNANGNWVLIFRIGSPLVITSPTLRTSSNINPTTTNEASLYYSGQTITLTRGDYENTTDDINTKYTLRILKNTNLNDSFSEPTWSEAAGPTNFLGNISQANAKITYTISKSDAVVSPGVGNYFVGRVRVDIDVSNAASTDYFFDTGRIQAALAKLTFTINTFTATRNTGNNGTNFSWTLGGLTTAERTSHIYTQVIKIHRYGGPNSGEVVYTRPSVNSGTLTATIFDTVIGAGTYYASLEVIANDGWRLSSYPTKQIYVSNNFTTQGTTSATVSTTSTTTGSGMEGLAYWYTGCCSTGGQVVGQSNESFDEAHSNMAFLCTGGGTVTDIVSGNFGTIPLLDCGGEQTDDNLPTGTWYGCCADGTLLIHIGTQVSASDYMQNECVFRGSFTSVAPTTIQINACGTGTTSTTTTTEPPWQGCCADGTKLIHYGTLASANDYMQNECVYRGSYVSVNPTQSNISSCAVVTTTPTQAPTTTTTAAPGTTTTAGPGTTTTTTSTESSSTWYGCCANGTLLIHIGTSGTASNYMNSYCAETLGSYVSQGPTTTEITSCTTGGGGGTGGGGTGGGGTGGGGDTGGGGTGGGEPPFFPPAFPYFIGGEV